MLLRSSSTPILNSWKSASSTCTTPSSPASSPEPEFLHQRQIYKSKSVSLTTSSGRAIPRSPSSTKLNRTSSETDLRDFSLVPTKKIVLFRESSISEREGEGSTNSSCYGGKEEDENLEPEIDGVVGRLLSSSGLGEKEDIGCVAMENRAEMEIAREELEVLVGGGIGGVGGGRRCGGGGGFGGRGCGDSNHGNGSTDLYYLEMIEANPGNSLILSNYARYLKEVRGDVAKAEEYYGRAILANPNDGNVLSSYADLIWQTHEDSSRAQTYFDQAVKAAPDDCYVMASYARFLWDSEEEEECDNQDTNCASSQSTYLHTSSHV